MSEERKSMHDLNEMYQLVKVDWTDFVVKKHDFQGDPESCFDVSPIEYLNIAEEKLEHGTTTDFVDAIGYIKRATEDQINLLVNALGFDYEKMDDPNTYSNVVTFVREYFNGKDQVETTVKIKLLNSLGLAPMMLIESINKLDKQLKNESVTPDKDEVAEALEIAELFIHSSNRKFAVSSRALSVGSLCCLIDDDEWPYHEMNYPYLHFDFDDYGKTKVVRATAVLGGKVGPCDYEANSETTLQIGSDHEQYLNIMKALIGGDYTVLPRIFSLDVEQQHLKYEIDTP